DWEPEHYAHGEVEGHIAFAQASVTEEDAQRPVRHQTRYHVSPGRGLRHVANRNQPVLVPSRFSFLKGKGTGIVAARTVLISVGNWDSRRAQQLGFQVDQATLLRARCSRRTATLRSSSHLRSLTDVGNVSTSSTRLSSCQRAKSSRSDKSRWSNLIACSWLSSGSGTR